MTTENNLEKFVKELSVYEGLDSNKTYIPSSYFFNTTCLGPALSDEVTFYLHQLIFNGLRIDATLLTQLFVTLNVFLGFMAEIPNSRTLLGKLCFGLWFVLTLVQVLLANASAAMAVVSEISFAIQYYSEDCILPVSSSQFILWGLMAILLAIYLGQSLVADSVALNSDNRQRRSHKLKLLGCSIFVIVLALYGLTFGMSELWLFIFLTAPLQPRILACWLVLHLYLNVLCMAVEKILCQDFVFERFRAQKWSSAIKKTFLGPFNMVMTVSVMVFVLSFTLIFSTIFLGIPLFQFAVFYVMIVITGCSRPSVSRWWSWVRRGKHHWAELVQYYLSVISAVSEDSIFSWLVLGFGLSPLLVFGTLLALKVYAGLSMQEPIMLMYLFTFQTPYRFVLSLEFTVPSPYRIYLLVKMAADGMTAHELITTFQIIFNTMQFFVVVV